MALSLAQAVFWTVLVSTPVAMVLFRARRWGGGLLRNTTRVVADYRWHLVLFFLVVATKNSIDRLNAPVRGVLGDFTWLFPVIEGGAVLWIQQTFEHPTLTTLLSIHYIWIFVFLNYFTILLYAYRNDRELAGSTVLCYLLLYVLAVPFYIFFNVQVTSDVIPGMKALMYHSGPTFYDFFTTVDPLDNAFPSLHIAVPTSFILVSWWAMRRRGYTFRDWEHRSYLLFMIVNTAVFAFSILYLGVHWITDIPGGIFLAFLGATLAEEFRRDAFGLLHRAERRLRGALALASRRAAPPALRRWIHPRRR